jgi:hypothetical protein
LHEASKGTALGRFLPGSSDAFGRLNRGTGKVYDNDTKRDEFTFNWGIIVRF